MQRPRKKIILVGGGGHCRSCIEAIESSGKYNIAGILDLPSESGKKILNYEIIGSDDDFLKFKNQDCAFLITVGQIKSAEIRKRIFNKLEQLNAEIETVVAATATVSKYAKIAKGTIVMHHVLVNAGVEIGENCIVNTGAIIEHDSKVGDHTHVSTACVVNGNCRVGEQVFIGSGSCISNGVQISAGAIIGAGSTVTNHIDEAGTYVGTPAKKVHNE